MTDLTQLNNQQLWQQIADSLNELTSRGVRIAAQHNQYIGPNYFGPYDSGTPGLCVMDEDDGNGWVVQDQTPRCAECTEPLPGPLMTYCSTRCRNAADRHDQDVEVDA